MGRPDSAAPSAAGPAPASSAFKHVLRFIVASLCRSIHELFTGYGKLDPVQPCLSGDVERLAVITPGAIGRRLRRLDGPQMFSLRRENPDTCRTGCVHVALRVHLHAIRKTGFLFGGHVGENFAMARSEERRVG